MYGLKLDNSNTHTIIKHTPLSAIYFTPETFIFSSCAFFTVHPIPIQVITTRAREGGPKKHLAKQKWPRRTHSVTYVPGLFTLSYLSCIVPQPPPSFLCSPRPPSHWSSIQANLGLPRTRPPITSAINTLLAIRYSSIISTCPNDLNTL